VTSGNVLPDPEAQFSHLYNGDGYSYSLQGGKEEEKLTFPACALLTMHLIFIWSEALQLLLFPGTRQESPGPEPWKDRYTPRLHWEVAID
jgi:hypothetical protein